MKISRLQLELHSVETRYCYETPRISREVTVTLDESRGLKATWEASIIMKDLEDRYDIFIVKIHLLNYKDLQNENILAFGKAYICGGNCYFKDKLTDTENVDLPSRYLQKITDDVVWGFEFTLDISKGSFYTFHASVALVYNEPTKFEGYFGDLLESGVHSDVVLMADQESFKVHKNIVSAKSAVFRKMFETDTKENNEGKVEIEDIRGPILREMLKSMYTGKLAPILEPGIVEDLYIAVNKYDVQDLKDDLSVKLLVGINPENVAKRLALAEQFGDSVLREKCLKFINGEPDSLSCDRPNKADDVSSISDSD